ncbi:MAG: PIN domain-containing protein [Isosphaeraceae bacterium]
MAARPVEPGGWKPREDSQFPFPTTPPAHRGLSAWLASLEREFSERILPIDAETGRIWGELTAKASKKGGVIAAVNGLIAATALRHGLRVMTRNEMDFRATGVGVINPWL